ncbi:SDR family oxidoreductase [soil metagenome]
MRRTLETKRIIVTGAGSGIGRALAAALVRAGAKVALASRNAGRLQQLQAELGSNALAVPTDITNPDDRVRLIKTVADTWGGLDVLANVAGIAAWGHFATSTEAINRAILETNFFAPVELIRLAVPHLTKGVQPLVVNLTSMTGRRGMPAWPEYSASKAALVGLSEALRGELCRFGIDILTVVPGLTKTDLQTNMLRNEGRVEIPYDTGMDADAVAASILTAIRRDKTEVVLGSDAKKILALNKWAPRLLNRLIARRVTASYLVKSS